MGKRKTDKEDHESVPPVNEDDEEDDEDRDAIVSEYELHGGDYELEDLQGNITVVKGPPMTKQEEDKLDKKVMELAKNDKRFEDHTENRMVRFNDIMNRAKAASNLRYQNIVECSDDSKELKKIPKNRIAIIQCRVGSYIETGVSLSGAPKLRQLTEDEKKQMDATDSEPCDCQICKKRRENSVKIIAPPAGLRSVWDVSPTPS